MSVELVKDAAWFPRGEGFPSKPRTPAEREALDFIARAVRGMQSDVTDYLGALVNKHSRQDYDFKQILHRLDEHAAMLKGFAKRIRELETWRGNATTPEHPGRGHWRLPLKRPARSNSPIPGVEGDKREQGRQKRDDLTEYENRPRPAIGALPDYAGLRAEAAEKVERELPATISTTELARYFGVRYMRIRNLMLRGELGVIRDGRNIVFPREEVVQYVRSRGVPKNKAPHYGASGIRMVPAKERGEARSTHGFSQGTPRSQDCSR